MGESAVHEFSAIESILNTALQQAQAARARRVTGLHLVVGPLADVEAESVQFYWDEISRGTLAEGARLHYRRSTVEFVCVECGSRFAPQPEQALCPICGGQRARLLTGGEFYLEAIDVEESERGQP
jgi:hydrogenase nickel incorporation protein HypA/HybF